MSRIHQLVDELRRIEALPGHKAALDIARILKGNRGVFKPYIDESVLRQLENQFEEMSEARPAYYTSELFRREFKAAYDLLMFYAGRII